MTGVCTRLLLSVLMRRVYWPGCNSVSPKYAAVGSSNVPFSTGWALARAVVKPSAKPSSAKPIVNCFRPFMVILL